MTETAPTAPAPTREVLGDVLLVLLEFWKADLNASSADNDLAQVVMRLAQAGPSVELVEHLKRFSERQQVRAAERDALLERLEALMRAYAGGDDA